MICVHCQEPTPTDPCAACGDPAAVDGRFRLEQVVGQGAFGTTWRAQGPAGVVAVKQVALRGTSEKARTLLEREAQVLRQLAHPGIPRHVDHFTFGRGRARRWYLVQDFVPGPTLAGPPRAEADVRGILDDALGILEYLHGLSPPVVHRDLKPANLIRSEDRLFLLDFGAVRDAWRGDLGGSTVAGTFGFMAPEQFRGDATPATDVFGLGATAVALVTGEEPRDFLDHPDRWRASVSPELAEVLAPWLAFDADARPTAAEARALLRAVPVPALPEEPPAIDLLAVADDYAPLAWNVGLGISTVAIAVMAATYALR